MRGPAHVTTDGSVRYLEQHVKQAQLPGNKVRGFGGWAAIVEYGSEGWVLRGQHPVGATSTQMELRAMIAGLRSLPRNTRAVLHTDATVAWQVLDRWQRGELEKVARVRDSVLWLALAAEFSRLQVKVDMILKGDRSNLVHRRAHLIAGEEAKLAAGYQGEPLKVPGFREGAPTIDELRIARRRARRRPGGFRAPSEGIVGL